MNSDGVTPESPAPTPPPDAVPPAPTAEPQVEYGPPMPPDYKQISIVFLVLLLLSIPLSCCCIFFGYGIPSIAGSVCALVALIQSGSVSQLYMAGNFEAAEKMSAKVRKWLIASVIVPFIVAFLMLVVVLAIAGISALVERYQQNSN